MLTELFGAIERGLGALLSGIYDVIPHYGIAIMLLTVAVRVLLIPVTVKQIRGMAATQKLQPEMAKIRQKYKQLQQKAKDRMEVQQLRLKMNEEIQGVFKAHGVHPASGCLPLIAQMPFFIALFSIVRATLVVLPATVALQGGVITGDIYTEEQLKQTVCRPEAIAERGELPQGPRIIECSTEGGETRRFEISGEFRDGKGRVIEDVSWITHCRPEKEEDALRFRCQSALSTGHIPTDSRLFNDLTLGKAKFFGMQPGCRPSDSANDFGVRNCTSTEERGGLADALPYFLLVLLIVGTQYYQSKQMMQRMHQQGTDLSPQAQSQQTMMKIMPLAFGFLSFTLPAGSNMYFLATNVWTIGQQHIVFSRQQKKEQSEAEAKGETQASNGKSAGKAPAEEPPAEKPKPPARPPQANRNASKKKKKKRR